MRTLEEKIAVLDRALEDPAIYSDDPKKAADFARLRTKLADDLAAREADWLDAQTALDETVPAARA
jgi:ATP-binding cassette subfamily F protein 3